MKNAYMMDLDDPNDWLGCRQDPNDGHPIEEQHDLFWPEGPDMMYEMNDSYFYGETTYHEHKVGWETFFIHRGKMDITICGKTATIEPGDVVCIPPWTPHQMKNLEEGGYMVWNGLFHGIGMLQHMHNWALIQRTNPEMMKDPEIQMNYLGNKNNVLRENPTVSVRVNKEDIYNIRPYGKPLAKFEYDGCVMEQYTGRWENAGLSEVWLAKMKKGFSVNYKTYNPNVDMYYIRSGQVKFTIAGEEFIAGPRCVVKAPHYSHRKFEVLEDCEMYDCGGSTHWLDFQEDIRALQQLAPEKLQNNEYVRDVFRRHECYLENVTYIDKVIL